MTRRLARLLPLALAVGMLTVAGWPCQGAGQALDPALGPEALIDRQAPELDARFLEGGEPVRLADLRGKVVVLELISSWCRACVRSAEFLDGLFPEEQGRGLVVLGVTRRAPGGAATLLTEHSVSFPLARDDGDTFRRYGVRLLPTMLVIDRAGFVRRVFTGASDETLERLRSTVREMLTRPG